ncbi:MAG TPA: heparan-alpha-glucosaminide N-acetyltransferase domain-containing protein [Parafilimonas sp.]|nr:heparan-alpha-glucosaminide N-acetyltransferase domain-containing protein [Parafilimonas sp.]
MQRVRSLDILRGAIMILMAVDHVRVYSGIPAGGPDPGIFFTRWITHFCAPGFAFFAGTSIFLHAQKLNDVNKLSRFLVTRGLLLVLLEETFIRFCWCFNLNYSDFFLAGVIWMLGLCMVLMALLVRLKPRAAGIIGLVIILAQQAFRYVPLLLPAPVQEPFSKAWNFIYPTNVESSEGIAILYVIVPWIGVMAAGYGFGLIVNLNEAKRKRICLLLGLTCIILFLLIGSIIILKNPSNDAPPFIYRLLNQQKYPASQLFLLMMLGPLITFIPLVEKTHGWFVSVLTTFGKVPMFYYLLHIPLIHVSALIVNLIRTGNAHQDWYTTAPFTWIPEADRWSLVLLYLIFILNVTILYFICKQYADHKSKHPEKKWVKYI